MSRECCTFCSAGNKTAAIPAALSLSGTNRQHRRLAKCRHATTAQNPHTATYTHAATSESLLRKIYTNTFHLTTSKQHYPTSK